MVSAIAEMTTVDFLSHLRDLGIVVTYAEGNLRISAPKDAITSELREELLRRKPEILDSLQRSDTSGRTQTAIEKISRDGEVALSFAQMRLWFLDQLSPGRAAYTIPLAIRIRGPLDVEILKTCISGIVRRHEVLRTVFPSKNGVPRQLILQPGPVRLDVVDLTGSPEIGREEVAHKEIATDAKAPFDLANGPLIRCRLLCLGSDDHILSIVVHHIVFDGWSVGIFWKELATMYVAAQEGIASPLADLQFQYADFASWQRRKLEGSLRESHLSYWRKQLAGNLSTLELPTDRSRRDSQTASGNSLTTSIHRDIAESLKRLSQHRGVSLYMTLLAAFHLLLHRLSGQNDILVGTPLAGHNRAEFEDCIGFFVNTLVVRSRYVGSESFSEFLQQIRDAVLDGQAHQELPFEELVGELDPQRDLTRSPLFQVFFNHLNLQTSVPQISGLKIEPFGEFELDSKFDFTLYSGEQQDNSVAVALLYKAALFDEQRMAIFLEQYADLLRQISEKSTLRLDEYSLVSSMGARALPDPTVPLQISWEGSVTAKFLENANRNHKQIAVEDSTGAWTYGDLERMSSGLAARLRSFGVKSGDTVAVFAHRSAPLVLSLLGILRAGAAFCILNPDYPSGRLISQIRRARPKAWIHIAAAGKPSQDVNNTLQEFAGENRIILPSTSKAASLRELTKRLESEIEVEPDSSAYLTFTSGTTGEPKCIIGTHRPVSHFLNWQAHEFGLKDTDRFSMLSGLAHDPLLRDVFAPLWVGGTICVPAGDEILLPGKLALWFNHHKITVTHLTPGLGALLAGPEQQTALTLVALPALRYAFFGGDVLLSRDVVKMREVAPRVQCVNFYGTTETPQAMGWHQVESAEQEKGTHAIPIGRAITDAQLIILNRSRGLAGPGELGEIYVRTPYLSKGYKDDERLTQERFIVNPFTNANGDRFYRTGDLGRYHPNGSVEFAGRSDDQLQIRGYKVEPAEVESALSDCPGVGACAVVARPDVGGGNQLVAYVTPQDGRVFGPGELRDLLRKSLPDHMVPSAYVIVGQLPLTPNGKVDRAALSRLALEQQTTSVAFVAATGDVEPRIATIWSEVLGIEKISVFENFFDLGGHSLSATRLIARLRSAFCIEFPLRSIFQDPTIAGFASHIHYDVATKSYSYTGESPRWNCLVPAQPRGSRTPLFLVAGYQGPDDTLLVLSRIIPHLGSDQPVYGFKPRWIEGNQKS